MMDDLTRTPSPFPRLNRENQAGIADLLADPSITVPHTEVSETASADFGVPLAVVEQEELAKPKEPDVLDDGVSYDNSPFNNPEFRKEVEARCSEMEMVEIAGTFRYQQRIPVIPGKLEVVMVSQNTSEICYVSDKTRDNKISDMISVRIEDLAVSIRSIEGSMLPKKYIFKEPMSLKDNDTVWDEKVFEDNLHVVKILPSDMIFILIPQFWWFRARLTDHLSVTNLKKSSS